MQGIYVLFSFMLMQQLQIMNKNLKTSLRQMFALLAFVNLMAGIFVLVITFLAK